MYHVDFRLTYLTKKKCKIFFFINKFTVILLALCCFYSIHQVSIVYLDCQYENLIGNGICNQEANNEDCQYDGGDCCYASCKVCSDGNCNSDMSKCIGKTDAGGKLFIIYISNICKV